MEGRRWFLKTISVLAGGLALFGLAGCEGGEGSGTGSGSGADSGTGTGSGSGGSGVATAGAGGYGAPASAATHTHSSGAPSDWREMDRRHAEGMKAFPQRTAGLGNQPLPFELEGDRKVFRLTATALDWEVVRGQTIPAMGFNTSVPGPQIRVREGEKVRIILRNDLAQSTSVHWHGLRVPNAMDGVTYLNQRPIPPGGEFVYEFTALPAGTHLYHAHQNGAEQVGRGMGGFFIIEDGVEADREYALLLGDGPLGYTINGKSFPATEPLMAKLGERVRIRLANLGTMVHPMHLHGLVLEVIAKDGYPLPQPFRCDTLAVAPGERYDVIVLADAVGPWLLHCHVLPHGESEHGMHGMTTLFLVEG